MRRRELLLSAVGTSAVIITCPSAGQSTRARLGWLSGSRKDMGDNSFAVLKQALARLGWKTGETIELEERHAEGDASKLPMLAAQLVAQHPTVIACTGATEAKALQTETRDIPVVFMQVPVDPVAAGFVQSITRPGGNLTGFLHAPQLLSGKRLDILAELVNRPLRHLACVVNPANANAASWWADAAESATKVEASIRRVALNTPAELESAFRQMTGIDGALVAHDFMFIGLRKDLATNAARQHLPVIYENQAYVAAGGLASYGADLRENYRQGAIYIDRILKGAHPRDLPVVQGTRFELVLNTAAARGLGLTIPPTLLARADEVIE